MIKDATGNGALPEFMRHGRDECLDSAANNSFRKNTFAGEHCSPADSESSEFESGTIIRAAVSRLTGELAI